MGPPRSTPWLAYRRPQTEPRMRLFCFPYAGGGASAYRGWERELPADVEVCLVQLPGRETRLREPPFRRVEPLVEAAAEALRLLGDGPVDLIVSDNKMPAMSGIEFCGRAARLWPGVPKVLITGWTEAVPREQLEGLGVKALIPKPWDDAELKRTLREVLDRRG